MSDYVVTARGRKIHRRDPEMRFATVCGKPVASTADPAQVQRAPYLICSICARS